MVHDDDMLHQINVNIVSSPVEINFHPREVTLLCDPKTSPISHQVEAMVTQKGFRVEFWTLDQMPPADQDVVSLLDLTAPFFDNLLARKLSAFHVMWGA